MTEQEMEQKLLAAAKRRAPLGATFRVGSPTQDSTSWIIREAAQFNKMNAGSSVEVDAPQEEILFLKVGGAVYKDTLTPEQKQAFEWAEKGGNAGDLPPERFTKFEKRA